MASAGAHARLLAAFGLFQYTLPLKIYPCAQQFITTSAAGIVNAMTPIMVVLISQAWPGGEKAVWSKSVGVALGFLGMPIVIWPELQGQGASKPYAMLATIAAPACYGIALNLIRYFDWISRTVMTAWPLLLGTLFLAPLALGLEGMPVHYTAPNLGEFVCNRVCFDLGSVYHFVLAYSPCWQDCGVNDHRDRADFVDLAGRCFSFGSAAVFAGDWDGCYLSRVALCRRAAFSYRA